jgi:hypothetical protein
MAGPVCRHTPVSSHAPTQIHTHLRHLHSSTQTQLMEKHGHTRLGQVSLEPGTWSTGSVRSCCMNLNGSALYLEAFSCGSPHLTIPQE